MLWPFDRRAVHSAPRSSPLYLYNTLTKSIEQFRLPAIANKVRMYNCGPTVYDRQHVGNLSMYVFTDILRRILEYHGFAVKQVINITDVGHLTSDADEGDDKMMKGLKREKLKPSLQNMRVLADKYTALFQNDIATLNIDISGIEFPRASDYIAAQIAMIESLEQKGYAYRTESAVYFDTSRFAAYGALGGIDLSGLKEGARVKAATEKRNPTDFALWKLNPPGSDDARQAVKKIGWDSPWGKGFPGWHIECSAMIRRCLGEQIDIHTGGIEHIPIHHNNEIAQSEAATGKRPLARFWLHRAHIHIDGGKLAKSKGKVVYLSDIVERDIHPLSLRYFFLGAHYRTNANFSWDALEAAQTAYLRLRSIVQSAPEGGSISPTHHAAILERLDDDLDTPGALSRMWDMTKDSALSPADMRATVADIDRILGLRLAHDDALAVDLTAKLFGRTIGTDELPADIVVLIEQREKARSDKDWNRADEIRAELLEKGYAIDDRPEGPLIKAR
jgi:cysteinyl-tRNA synthetase